MGFVTFLEAANFGVMEIGYLWLVWLYGPTVTRDERKDVGVWTS